MYGPSTSTASCVLYHPSWSNGLGGVEVAEHGRLRPQPQHALHDPCLAALAPELQPERAVAPRSGRQHAELGEAVGLLEADAGERAAEGLERAGGHGLRPVRDQPQGREVVPRAGPRDHQHAQERRRGREQLDALPLDGPGHGIRAAVLADDQRAAVGQRVQHRVDAAQVIEPEEHQGPVARPCLPVRRGQRVEVEERPFALAGGPGGEHHQSPDAAVAQPGQHGRWGGAGRPRAVGPASRVGEVEERIRMRGIEMPLRVLPGGQGRDNAPVKHAARKSAQTVGE